MTWTDDPVADYMRHDAEQQSRLDKLPVCVVCQEPIQQETAVVIDGRWYCDDCLEYMREYTGGDDL